MSDVEIIDLCAYEILSFLSRMPGSMTTTIYDYVFEGSKNTKQSRLKYLIEKGLVKQRESPDSSNKYNTKRYDITPEGKRVLDLMTSIHVIIKERERKVVYENSKSKEDSFDR